MPTFTIKVNEVEHNVDAEPNMPLLWVLRDVLNLTGTKFGCGAGLCGACTVLLDGKAARSCITIISQTTDRAITTIEGLSPEGQHPIQQAWLAEAVPQCGYCQPGKIMNTAGLLNENPHPTDAEIDEAFNDHLCRCGTYLRIRRAIHRAAEGG